MTFVEFPQFPAIFDILESSICISHTFCRSKAEDTRLALKKMRKMGKIKFSESYSEYHHFMNSLRFDKTLD